jgi:transposase
MWNKGELQKQIFTQTVLMLGGNYVKKYAPIKNSIEQLWEANIKIKNRQHGP